MYGGGYSDLVFLLQCVLFPLESGGTLFGGRKPSQRDALLNEFSSKTRSRFVTASFGSKPRACAQNSVAGRSPAMFSPLQTTHFPPARLGAAAPRLRLCRSLALTTEFSSKTIKTCSHYLSAQFGKMPSETSDTFARFGIMPSEASETFARFGMMPSETSDTSARIWKMLSETSDTSAQFGKMSSEPSETFARFGKMPSEVSDTSAQFGMMPSEPSDTFAQVGEVLSEVSDTSAQHCVGKIHRIKTSVAQVAV